MSQRNLTKLLRNNELAIETNVEDVLEQPKEIQRNLEKIIKKNIFILKIEICKIKKEITKFLMEVKINY